ncbi:Aldose 1-epimerase, subgroup [Niveomyces insectorum RCEF 264]|uniref:Aldose 1-epimerase, subgroup n=1 Tax=Niveomyces insectorum RCEF 264 TaxID=1081102 RepID=A0A167XRH1_9HYPO|nr:Aldose 1-epimerase, subgroup [Niveomyces insectorum RCEF 264]
MADSPVVFLPRGAIIQRFDVDGVNIVQGFPTEELYAAHNSPYFGETIGRVANRIGGAAIRVPGGGLNGRAVYPLAANNGANALHGGRVGWGKKTWDGPTPVGVRAVVPGLVPEALDREGGESVRFTLVSPDGDEGYPGTVHVSVTYTVGRQTLPAEQGGAVATVLVMDYEAQLVDGADETIINMTNHRHVHSFRLNYFNLTGGPSIEGTVVELATNTYLPVDDGGIPTGGPTAFGKVQAQTPFTLGAAEPDIDDCFVVNDQPATVPLDTRAGGAPLTRLVAAHHPATGIHLEVLSTEPAFQFYTGKYIDVPAVGGLPARHARSGFCVEPGRYVNASNEAAWKDMVVLKKGETFGARTVYRAWKA